MKKFLATALLFASAFAFAEGYEDWFTPPNKWEGVKAPVKLVLNYKGSPITEDFSVGINDTLDDMLLLIDVFTEGLPETAKNAFKMSRLALANSLYASCQAHMNKLKIDNLGAALEGVFVSTYGQYQDEDGNVISKSRSGVDTAKLRQQLLANKNAVVSGGQAAGGSENNPLKIIVTQKPYDERQFEQHIEDGKSLTSLYGWYGLSDSTTSGLDGADGWAFAHKDYFIPYSNGKSSTLGWLKWNGLNLGCLSVGDDVQGGNNDQPLRLRGWTTANNCSESIQNLLTNKTATTDRSRHKILTRYDAGNGATIHWMPFAETTIGGSEGYADDKSIELTQDAGASSDDPKKFRLKGFAAANTAAIGNPKNAKIPMADGTENLAWKKPSDLFNETVFDTDSNGKIVIKSTVEQTGEREIMTITQTSGSGGITSQTIEGKSLAALTDDTSLGEVDIGGGEKRIGIKNWNTVGQASAGFTIADKLENGSGYVNDPTRSPAVVIRNGGTLQYAALGRISPAPQNDDLSITTNYTLGASEAGKASIRGYRDANIGAVPRKTSNGLDWVDMLGVDDKSIETNNSGQITIKGFATANASAVSDPKDLTLACADGSTDLAWKKPTELFNSTVFGTDDNGKIILKSTVEQSGKTELMTITQTESETGGVTAQTIAGKSLGSLTDDASLGEVQQTGGDVKVGIKNWLTPASATANYTVADKLLDGTSETPASAPAVLVRDGTALKFAAFGKINPPVEADDITTTTNLSNGASVEGKMGLFGYSAASAGQMPVKGENGLEWTDSLSPDDMSVETNGTTLALKGFEEAKTFEGVVGAVVPFVDETDENLQWGSIMDFFADSVFRQSETTGKILLNGTSEEGKVKVLAITGSGGDDQNISSLTFDNTSVDGNPSAGGIVQLHNFNTAPSPYADGGVSFADVLTNTTTQITGMSVPVRIPAQGTSSGATVAYVPMGKITGIPSAAVDNVTVEVNETDPQNTYLQLHGAAGEGITLNEGDVYQIGGDGKGKFAKLGAEEDDSEVYSGDASIESYTSEDGGRYFRLKDWTDNRSMHPHILGWSNGALSYWLADGANGIAVKDTDEGEKLMLDNFDTAAVGAMPYKTASGLGWMDGADNRIPLLHSNGAPSSMAIGGSLDKNNVSAVPTLNVKGFTSGGGCSAKLNTMLSDPADSANRNAHQFMARYSTGSGDPTVHWVGIDGIISAGEQVDNRSITTNYSNGAYEDGMASLWGFRLAADGDTPIKQGEALVWRPSLEISNIADGVTLTNVNGKISIVGWENVPSNQVLYAEWDEDNNTNHLRWVEWDLNRCHCPNHCPIHDEDYVNGFCPVEGCPHSMGGVGISTGANDGGSLDDI